MSKLILFGAGKRFERIIHEKKDLLENNEVVLVVDNDQKLWGKKRADMTIFRPEKIFDLHYDYIVITVADPREIYKQLISYGILKEKILTFKQFLVNDLHGVFKEYGSQFDLDEKQKNFLIIAVRLAYNGGTVAVINAAKALRRDGYKVMIAAPSAEETILRELINEGLSVTVMPALDAPGGVERRWVSRFDYILVNSVIMLPCVYEFQDIKSVIFWLHESSFFYFNILQENIRYSDLSFSDKTRVMAVSDSARKCFEKYFPGRVDGILPIAVPDYAIRKKKSNIEPHFVFAFIGEIFQYKGVDKIIDAFEGLPDIYKSESELWLIGKNYNDDYGVEIKEKAHRNGSIKLLGMMTQKEIESVYEKIDVLICASPEETLSTVCVDAMKHRKLCIISRGAGVTYYLTEGENALIFDPMDISELITKMTWAISHRGEAETIAKRGRKVYEKDFTYEIFAKRLRKIIEEIDIL